MARVVRQGSAKPCTAVRSRSRPPIPLARRLSRFERGRVAELVYATDLKFVGLVPCGFESHLAYQNFEDDVHVPSIWDVVF